MRSLFGPIVVVLLVPASAYSATLASVPSPSVAAPAQPSDECPLSQTALPPVLDGTNAWCPTCSRNALEQLGNLSDQANALVTGANRVKASIGELVRAQETGYVVPRYATIAHDAGGLSYGAYQFSQASGELAGMLQYYLRVKGDPATTHLFNSYIHGGHLVNAGSHVFKMLLQQAASDPVMQYAQDRYFQDEFLDPALADASQTGIRTPLGGAILVDAMTNGGYDSIMAAAKRQVPHVNGPDDEARFLNAFLDARDARYRALARSPLYRRYLKGWLNRDNDYRRLLAAGNFDLEGHVNIASKGTFCGGGGEDAQAFRLWMASADAAR